MVGSRQLVLSCVRARGSQHSCHPACQHVPVQLAASSPPSNPFHCIARASSQVFLDVVESVNLLVNSNGTVVRSEVVGALKMRAYLSGMVRRAELPSTGMADWCLQLCSSCAKHAARLGAVQCFTTAV